MMTPYELIADSNAIYLDTCALVKIDAKEERESNFTRVLAYFSKIPVFTSFVGFGEFISVLRRLEIQKLAEAVDYLFCCRNLMVEFDNGRFKRVEPVEKQPKFSVFANELSRKHGRLGGGDVWHLMAALNLQSKVPQMTFVSFDQNLVKAACSEGMQAVKGTNLSAEELLETLKRLNKYIGQ